MIIRIFTIIILFVYIIYSANALIKDDDFLIVKIYKFVKNLYYNIRYT